ncbi:hypothetical protein AAC387_Pa02g1248 [Persea americana]
MGSCLSSETESVTSSTAKVISSTGFLREYSVPVTASQVLHTETDTPASFFLCNSDKLYFDSYIPPLKSHEQLQVDQIYFLLPIIKLKHPLTASGMAALAVKASTALSEGSTKKSRRTKKIQVLPVSDVNQGDDFEGFDGLKRFGKKKDTRLTRSGSMRKLQSNASKKAKIAYRSFRMRLSTIHEETAGR